MLIRRDKRGVTHAFEVVTFVCSVEKLAFFFLTMCDVDFGFFRKQEEIYGFICYFYTHEWLREVLSVVFFS